MKFKENLRWWFDWLGHLIENDPAWNADTSIAELA